MTVIGLYLLQGVLYTLAVLCGLVVYGASNSGRSIIISVQVLLCAFGAFFALIGTICYGAALYMVGYTFLSGFIIASTLLAALFLMGKILLG